MPPGPPGLPLLGNYLDMKSFLWLQLTKWKEQYGMLSEPRCLVAIYILTQTVIEGPIFSLNLAGQPVVVVNDFTTAADLLGDLHVL